MVSEEEKKEVIVNAPSKSVFSEEKKAEKAAVKALEEERYNVISINKTVGQYFGLSSVIVGIVLLLTLVFNEIINQSTATLFFADVSVALLGLLVAAGLISVFVGFLLITSE
jgi:pheromone shutdown protein TraB